VADAIHYLESCPELAGWSVRRLEARDHLSALYLCQELAEGAFEGDATFIHGNHLFSKLLIYSDDSTVGIQRQTGLHEVERNWWERTKIQAPVKLGTTCLWLFRIPIASFSISLKSDSESFMRTHDKVGGKFREAISGELSDNVGLTRPDLSGRGNGYSI
jgi:hypothetical protein